MSILRSPVRKPHARRLGGVAKPKWYADNASMLSGKVFMTRTRPKIHDPRPACLALIVALLAGCATAPPPIQMMDRAQSEIRAARAAGAAATAPDVLAEAERRLAAAQQFSTNNDNDKAADKASEAEAAAATARARADAARLNRQIQQQTSVNDSLKADLERRQAAAAAAQQAATAPPPAPAGSTGQPASAASSAAPSGMGPVTLPSIELGQPSTPAPSGSAGAPASAGTSGNPDAGVNP